MLYCKKCRGVCDESLLKCPNCKNTKLREVNDDDMVLLHRADMYTAQRLSDMFEEHGVEYELGDFGKGRVSYLYDSEVMPTDKTVYVKYRDLPTARGLSANLKEEIERENAPAEEFEEMSPKKRMLVQALSAIAFIAIVIVVVFCADAVANWLKGLFT